ncbi:hypothetical protein [Maribacter sp. Hel_I_7]|uniref:hypothetical protein n=1 Tax=Maribacter sp. Hel_I_7 TaxID=1249997 RepID=UPI000ABC02A4|nr:hypothetical protein [Maribacter sp. Hel_I_7]
MEDILNRGYFTNEEFEDIWDKAMERQSEIQPKIIFKIFKWTLKIQITNSKNQLK